MTRTIINQVTNTFLITLKFLFHFVFCESRWNSYRNNQAQEYVKDMQNKNKKNNTLISIDKKII